MVLLRLVGGELYVELYMNMSLSDSEGQVNMTDANENFDTALITLRKVHKQ